MKKTINTPSEGASSSGDSSSKTPLDTSPHWAQQAPSLEQPARAVNIQAIVSYFESGITEKAENIGIELEHTIVHDSDASPVSYEEEGGVRWILEKLESDYSERICDAEDDLLGLARPGETVTLEPAAQLELSSGPFAQLPEAAARFDAFERQLSSLLAPTGKRSLLVGYHPTAQAADLTLIPKRRYKFMDFYFNDIGSYGRCMMRGSASTQISIDYHSVDDCLRKLRLAFILTPLFALITDNSAVFEGKPRTQHLVRTKIWQECDPARCGLVPGALEPSFTLAHYAEYVLDTPAILMPCSTREWCYTEKTFGELYAHKPMDRAAVEHALSLLFNDVRLKTYLEIRAADAMPVPFVIAYAALIKGLFYCPENLDALDELFAAVDAPAVDEAKNALEENGYNAFVYGHPVTYFTDKLMHYAKQGLAPRDHRYLHPLDDLVARRITLADMAEKKPASTAE